eukprot:CAMPEP_0180515702 /NCGR_PEP_ID=MMETSP1036_2-20121128/53473_1 /TAXON_ID=632150 /ORGANISM="Azadinium spinosum, Strain 3D9" /LENGTH=85 /DNA_ID=CAMNT_0022527347 /DNA_START=31 /DNA_END=284 /DNA_ORIENTATION=-
MSRGSPTTEPDGGASIIGVDVILEGDLYFAEVHDVRISHGGIAKDGPRQGMSAPNRRPRSKRCPLRKGELAAAVEPPAHARTLAS